MVPPRRLRSDCHGAQPKSIHLAVMAEWGLSNDGIVRCVSRIGTYEPGGRIHVENGTAKDARDVITEAEKWFGKGGSRPLDPAKGKPLEPALVRRPKFSPPEADRNRHLRPV